MVFKKIFKDKPATIDGVPTAGLTPADQAWHQLVLRLRGTFDLDEVLQLAANTLGEQLGVDHCLIYLCDPNVDTLRWRAGYQQPELAPLRWPLRESDFADLFVRLRQGQIVRIDDPTGDPLVASGRSRFEAAAVRQLLFVPALSERLEAVIVVGQVRTVRPPTEEQLRMLEGVAALLALSVRHFMLQSALRQAGTQVVSQRQELERENQRLQELVGLLLLQPGDLSESVKLISQSLCHLYHLKACSIEQLQSIPEVGETTSLVLSLYLDGQLRDLGIFAVQGTPRQRVLELGEPQVMWGVVEAYPEDRFLRENELNFYAGVPIMDRSGSTCLGLLNLYHQEAVDLRARDLKLLQALARRIGTEMEMEAWAREHEQASAEIQWRLEAVSQVEEQVKFLQRARELLRQATTLEEGLQELILAANRYMGSDFAAIALYETAPGTDEREPQMNTDWPELEGASQPQPRSGLGSPPRTRQLITAGIEESVRQAIGGLPTGKGLLGVLAGWQGPLRLDNVAHHPHFTGFPSGHPVMRSFLGVPLTVRGCTVGAIYFADKHGGEPFSTEDELFATELAAQIALAVAAPTVSVHESKEAMAVESGWVDDQQSAPGPAALPRPQAPPIPALAYSFEAFLENITSGVVAVDSQGCITLFNPAMERLTGYRKNEVLGRKLTDGAVEPRMHTDEHGPRMHTDERVSEPLSLEPLPLFVHGHPLREAMNQGRVIHIPETQVLTSSGARKYVSLLAMPTSDEQGALAGSVAVVTDLSDRQALKHELELLSSWASIGQRSAHLVHQIKSPLATLMSGLELLKRRTQYGEREGEYFDRLMAELKRLDATAREILQLGAEPELRLELRDAAEPLERALEAFHAQMEAAHIGLELDLQLQGQTVLIDASQVEQAFRHLILNAIEAMPEGGTLTAKLSLVSGPSSPDAESKHAGEEAETQVERQGMMVEYTISDTGPGIPPSLLDRIFDPFFTTKPHGTGLGLAAVKNIVHAHQGQISVHSIPGQGTTVTVRLPLSDKPVISNQ